MGRSCAASRARRRGREGSGVAPTHSMIVRTTSAIVGRIKRKPEWSGQHIADRDDAILVRTPLDPFVLPMPEPDAVNQLAGHAVDQLGPKRHAGLQRDIKPSRFIRAEHGLFQPRNSLARNTHLDIVDVGLGEQAIPALRVALRFRPDFRNQVAVEALRPPVGPDQRAGYRFAVAPVTRPSKYVLLSSTITQSRVPVGWGKKSCGV